MKNGFLAAETNLILEIISICGIWYADVMIFCLETGYSFAFIRRNKILYTKSTRWQRCCWHRYVGDWFQMLVAESLCWRLFSLYWWFSQCIKSVTNILNRSPTSQTCDQHIWSPMSVTNIDVTHNATSFFSNMVLQDRSFYHKIFMYDRRKWPKNDATVKV